MKIKLHRRPCALTRAHHLCVFWLSSSKPMTIYSSDNSEVSVFAKSATKFRLVLKFLNESRFYQKNKFKTINTKSPKGILA